MNFSLASLWHLELKNRVVIYQQIPNCLWTNQMFGPGSCKQSGVMQPMKQVVTQWCDSEVTSRSCAILPCIILVVASLNHQKLDHNPSLGSNPQFENTPLAHFRGRWGLHQHFSNNLPFLNRVLRLSTRFSGIKMINSCHYSDMLCFFFPWLVYLFQYLLWLIWRAPFFSQRSLLYLTLFYYFLWIETK